ncbi:methyltransferase [Bosea sp. F3-2]|uniref:tRNA1(Val) (adenine(37)-N6)-methyltransferase n=1 Tax=Bosea sp. F3-2 TaxID=2599640 RepID=UPI0011EC914B|nr:methyltransferase [Bosea sp. F3-2]QEL23231.1 methyltransferase [Bosea sp. F3-2]
MSEVETELALGEIVEDRLLDGRLRLRQPRKGHRAGTDAILLAAALPELDGGTLLDIGAGVGTVGLAAALLRPALRVTLLERDPELAALAKLNIELNGMADRGIVMAADVTAPAAELETAGLKAASFDAVAMNPPFYPQGGTRASPTPNRRAAHVAEGGLQPWLRAARRALKPGGLLAIIHRAEALPDLLAGLAPGFGAVAIRPVHGVTDRPAIRVIVTAVLNSRKPAELLPAFVINGPDGRFTAESEAVHRGQARL